jgi:alpha-tubulin suppressor-like RCC1 family protein
MTRRLILRSAPLLLAAATLLSACAENLPSGAGARGPLTPRLTVTPTNAFASIDGGQSHACGLTSGGQAWCWGRNPYGQLGDSTATNRSTPVAVWQQGATYTSLTAGANHTCAIATGGQAWCWGEDADGRLGDSTTATIPLIPVRVHPLGAVAFTSLSAADMHTCGLDSGGQAYCWGSNDSGRLGNNSTAYALTPVAVQQGAVTYTQIQAGYWHTCALDGGGQAYCFGYGGDGALGYGFSLGDSVPQAVSQPAGVTFSSIYTEYKHTCALTSGGLAYCWGPNGSSQLGDSTTTRRYTPVAARMPAGVTYSTLALGSLTTCGLSTAGQAYCWGLGTSGQLGNGSTFSSRLPVAVAQPVGVTFTTLRAEGGGFCGLDTIGQTWCWGQNPYGQLGNGTTTNSSSPVAVSH